MPTSAPSSESSEPSAPATCKGRHLICELYGATHLDGIGPVTEALEDAARACGATLLDTRLHRFGTKGGITGVVLLAESHISIHTWPEHDYAAVDVFMCGDCDPQAALPILRAAFEPDEMEHRTLERGQRSAFM